jgi:hypothetical protein
MTEAPAQAPTDANGTVELTGCRCKELARIPICTREVPATLSAWRLAAESEEGAGAITLVEVSPGRSVYRGEGLFLGWPQERLEAAYRALQPRVDQADVGTQQLG